MMCPHCKALDKTVVIDKRNTGCAIRRRRKCLECGKRFTTYENTDVFLSRVDYGIFEKMAKTD